MNAREIKVAKGTKITRAVDKLNNDVAKRTLVQVTATDDDNGHEVNYQRRWAVPDQRGQDLGSWLGRQDRHRVPADYRC